MGSPVSRKPGPIFNRPKGSNKPGNRPGFGSIIGRPKPVGSGMTRPLPPQMNRPASGQRRSVERPNSGSNRGQLKQSEAIQQLAKVLVNKKNRKSYRRKDTLR